MYICIYIYIYIYIYNKAPYNADALLALECVFVFVLRCVYERYVSIYIHTHICMYIYIHVYMYSYAYIHTIYVYMYKCIHMHIYIHTYTCMYIRIYVYIYTCIYTYIYNRTHYNADALLALECVFVFVLRWVYEQYVLLHSLHVVVSTCVWCVCKCVCAINGAL